MRPFDSDGYPTEVVRSSTPYDPHDPLILINDIYSGDYVFLYDGEGELEFAEGVEVVSSEPNKILLKLTECEKTSTSDPHRRIIIRSSKKGNHIRNMRMIPVEYMDNEIWDSEIVPNATNFAQMVSEYEISYVVYEGGQHMQPFNQKVWEYNEAVYEAQIHPKMYDLYMKNFELYASLNCQMFVNFSYVSARKSQYGSWGVLENLSDIYSKDLKEIAPKYKAIIDANRK